MGKSCVVAVLKKRYKEGPAPLDAVKTRIEPLARREKKAALLLDQAQKAINQSQNIEAIATQLGTKVDTLQNITFASFNLPGGYGPEKDIIGTIFSMKEGQTSEPVKGNQGVYVFTIDKLEPPAQVADFTQQKRVLSTSVKGRAAREVYTALEEKADIEDNRIRFY